MTGENANDAPAKPPTLAEVALLARVSVPTASRVLNPGTRGADSGSAEVRQRVSAAAAELGYTLSPAARTVKRGRADTIALLVSDIEDAGAATIVVGVMHAAESRGLSVAVRTTLDDPDRELALLRSLRGERHRGVVVATSRTTNKKREAAVAAELDLLVAQGARVAVIGTSSLGYPSVTIDNVGAAGGLASSLTGLGARRFGVLAGPRNLVTSADRLRGFLSGLPADADVVQVVHAEFSRDGGHGGFEQLAGKIRDLDIVAAMSDAMAIGAIGRAHELGLSVPRDIEITGFDAIPVMSDLVPAFSSVIVPLELFGEASIRLVTQAEPAQGDIRLDTGLIVRGERLA